jgi:hypothetical protein
MVMAAGCRAGWRKVAIQTPSPVEPLRLHEGALEGSLRLGDRTDRQGRFFDTYLMNLSAGQRLRIWVVEAGIDTVLNVQGPGGAQWQNDDFLPGDVDPQLEFTAPQQGAYLVRVTAFGPGQSGQYRLGRLPLEPAEEPTVGEGLVEARYDPSATGGDAAGSHWLRLVAGQRVRLWARSTDFDATLSLWSPSGQLWQNDDAPLRAVPAEGATSSEHRLDSRLLAMAPADGWYHVVVAPYGGNGSGTYRLEVDLRPPVLLAPGEAVPSVGFAGREGEGRILGLFAGISAYSEGRRQLFGCADDAQLLAAAFRERGLQRPEDQTVLTDLNANTMAFTAGLQRLAQQATDRDVVIIFFSGHGGTQATAASSRHDPDGTDETLVLADGEVVDDELVALIDQIQADVVILALDSCHSGGFAEDFLVRHGRIGLFSSDADVLSDTAQPLRAGGYLASFLRDAVRGEADNRPANGLLSAGELTDYLHQGFVRAYHMINPPHEQEPQQWLVARRGTVGWHAPLWVYPRRPDGGWVAPVQGQAVP